MDPTVQDNMQLLSQYYPSVIFSPNAPPAPGESKPRRRRRKSKGSESTLTGAKKRKLSAEQVNLLEENFGSEHKLESVRKDKLASELGLDPRQVAIWFQNRRARWKNKKLEDEYNKLRTAHETTIVEKCHLESEILKLQEQLSEAKKELQRLSERGDGASSTSPSSSLSIEANNMDAPFLGEFGAAEGYEYGYYMSECNYISLDLFSNIYM